MGQKKINEEAHNCFIKFLFDTCIHVFILENERMITCFQLVRLYWRVIFEYHIDPSHIIFPIRYTMYMLHVCVFWPFRTGRLDSHGQRAGLSRSIGERSDKQISQCLNRPFIFDTSFKYRPMSGYGSTDVPSVGGQVLGRPILVNNRPISVLRLVYYRPMSGRYASMHDRFMTWPEMLYENHQTWRFGWQPFQNSPKTHRKYIVYQVEE